MPSTPAETLLDLFARSETIVTVKPWGYELTVTNPEFTIKFIRVQEDHACSLQFHSEKDEAIAVLRGGGYVYVEDTLDDHVRKVRAGDGPVRIRPGTIHRSIGPVDLIEVSTSQLNDVVRLQDEYGRSR